MKRKREEEKSGNNNSGNKDMEIVWQTPANPPQLQDYIFRDGNTTCSSMYTSIRLQNLAFELSNCEKLEFCAFCFGGYSAGKRYVRPYYFEFIAHVSNFSLLLFFAGAQ